MLSPSIIQIPFEVWGALFCLMCGFIVFATRKGEIIRSRFLMYALITEALQLTSDAFAIGFRGNITTAGFYIVRISNFLVFFANYMMCIWLIHYISATIVGIESHKKHLWIKFVTALNSFGIILLVISLFIKNFFYNFDEKNLYHRADFYWLNMLIPIISIAFTTALIIKYRKNLSKANFSALLIYLLLPLIATIVQTFVYGLSLTNMTSAITTLLLFVVHEVDKSERLIEKEKEVARQKEQLSETKVSLMMSKIHPHFISNTLLTIQGLYHMNIDDADRIMNTFIRYLQQSFSNISVNVPVDFSMDLEHAKNYTDISLARWPDMTIEYNIECVDFKIPYLTLQPLIENAVRHGLMPLEEGGKITVSTYEDDAYNYISIVDNGVGFDINNPISHQFKNDRAHIGLSNVKDRIKIMSHGTLEIDSVIDKGTTILIKLPKEEAK